MIGIKRPNTEEELIDSLLLRSLRSGIGSLLYLIKHSKPDIANGVRELSVGEYHLWTSKRTENRQLNEWDYTIDKYETLAIC